MPGERWPLLLVVLLGFGLRLYHLSTQSLWYDEAFAVWLARQSPAEIVANVELEHTPFYFLLLHGWMLLTGQSEHAVRYLSLLVGVLTIPATYVVGKRLFDRAVGLVAALLVAASPFAIWYSQETRMYALVMLVASLSTYFMIRAVEGQSRFWVAYALTAAALPYVHYYGLMVVIGQAAYVAGRIGYAALQGRSRPPLLPWLAAEVATAVMFVPWALLRSGAFDGYVSAARSTLTLESMFWKTVIAFTSGDSIAKADADLSVPTYLAEYNAALLIGGGFLAITVLGLLMSRGGGKGHEDTEAKSRVRSVLLLTVLIVVPFAVVYISSLGRRAYVSRYLIGLAPLFYLLLAYAWDALRRRHALLAAPAAALVVGAFTLSLSNYYNQPRFWREDYRDVAAYAASHARPEQVFVCNAGYSGMALDYYRPGQEPCVAVPAEYPPVNDAAERQLEVLAERYRFLWLVLWQDYYSDPDKAVANWLDGHAFRVEERAYPGGLRLRGYYLAPPIVGEAEVPNRLGATLGGKVRLVGYDFSPPVAGEESRVRLYWQALAPLEEYRVFVHVVDGAGEKWAQHDGPPASGSYPTTSWSPGQIVIDEHSLMLPALIPPAGYRIEVGMYEPGSLKRLGDRGEDHVFIQGFDVSRGVPDEPKIQNQVNTTFGKSVTLLGYDYGTAQRGESLRFTLYWKALAPMDADYTVFVHLLDAAGDLRAQTDYPPARGIFPTSKWQPGDVVPDARSVEIPTDLPAGEYSLVVGLYEPGSSRRLQTESGFLGRGTDDKLRLRTIRLD